MNWFFRAVAGDLRSFFTRDRAALISAQAHEDALTDRVLRAAHPTRMVKVGGEITEREAGILRAALRADLERIIYSGDHPRCPACVIGWDGRADRSHVTEPCPDYPACSIPAPTGRHRLTWTEAEL